MVITAIISFTASATIAPVIDNLIKKIGHSDEEYSLTIGNKVQDPATIQITSRWPSFQSCSALRASSNFQRFTQAANDNIDSVPTTTIAAFQTVSISSLPNTLPLTEWVKIDFPARETSSPAFQAKIESDFARFEVIFRRRGSAHSLGEGELSVGWAEEQDNTRSFVVSRQWRSMSAFEEAIRTEFFKEGVEILMGWGAPFSLWHVEQRETVA